ncbi:hypothetical protein QQ045_010644 [Rhodiola kirilowii]
MNATLIGNILEEEIHRSIFAQGPLKAPGFDGFLGIFYQKHWELIKHRITGYVRRFWEDVVLDREMNKTLIVLIPKKGDVISIYQSAFVKGRIISDNFIVAHEVSHFLKNGKSGSSCYASIKLDMSKAYDRVEWCFLESIMHRLGFAEKWISGIKIRRIALIVTHLFFADDFIFFIKADPEEATRRNEAVSGQRINLEKYEVSFNPNTPDHIRRQVAGILGVHQFPRHSKYLGLSLAMGHKKTEMCRVLLAKYCLDETLGSARLGSSPSHVWRGVLKALEFFKLGSWWDDERGTVRWMLTSNGLFTVRSAYELILKAQMWGNSQITVG